MKIGVSGFAWTGAVKLSHVDLLPRIREYGFAGFEVPMFVPSALPVKALRKGFAENDLECTVCAILPAGINPISPDAETRVRSRDHLLACIETAAEMGATLLGGPLYAPIGYVPAHRPTQDEWRWAVEMFQSLVEALEQCEVTLAIEPVNRAETFFLRTAREARELCELVDDPRVGVTLDTFHANIEEKDIGAAIECLGPHLKHLHASENDRGMLGEGHVDFAAVAEGLERIDYEGYWMIEGFGYCPGDVSAPGALWAEVTTSPEELACKGLAYLRTLVC